MTLAETPLWTRLASLRSRLTFRFTATGRGAAGLVTDGRGSMFCEYWRLGRTNPACQVVDGYTRPATDLEDPDRPYDVVPFDNGSVLLVSSRELLLIEPGGRQRSLGQLSFRPDVVAGAPDGSARVLFVGRAGADPDGECVAWLLPGPTEHVRHLGTLPPLLLRGGGWLDIAGTRYLLNRRGSGLAPAVYQMASGELTALDGPSPADGDIAWLTAPATGAVLLANTAEGRHQLRFWCPDRSVRSLAVPATLTGTVTPLALHPEGRLVALQVRDGLREDVAVLDTQADAVGQWEGPTGRAVATAAWLAERGEPQLWCLSVGSGFPASIIGRRSGGWIEVRDRTPAGDYDAWAPSHLKRLPGAESEIEAIVCGHEDWRSARSVVLALHGGPASRWSLKFSQLFQTFAAEGITVVAPNPRGSTGYGEQFHRQIVNRWAGPDLADVLAIAKHLSSQRQGRKLAIYGASYGAFLALLAASVEPQFWSRVLAVAPMLSGGRLYPEASAKVRSMIDKLGGRTCLTDRLGPRDVLAQVPTLTARLLLIHGAADDLVPVSQSRRLVHRLTALGRQPREDYYYCEVPGLGHSPLDGSARLQYTAARFLAHGDWPEAAGIFDDGR